MTAADTKDGYAHNILSMEHESGIDDAGQKVIRFMGDVVNFTRIGELVGEVLDMARSQAWRNYRTAVGSNSWRECEFDYFLIECNIPYNDAARALAWGKAGEEIGKFMDPDVPTNKRRTLEQAAKAYVGAGPESLTDRAARLGWTNKYTGNMRKPPISTWARSLIATGDDLRTAAAKARANKIPASRRRELDRLAKTIIRDVPDETERRYLIDQISPAKRTRKVGQR